MSTNPKSALKFITSPKGCLSSHKSSLSENRYNTSAEDPDLYYPSQGFSIKEISVKGNSHSRGLSQPLHILTPEVLFGHKRQQSLGQRPLGQLYDTSQQNTPKCYDKENDSYKSNQHSRKISDFDIVVFGDNDPGTSNEMVKRSLPVFGRNPCCAYCKDCDREVHTMVEFTKKNAITFNVMEFVSTFFACCGEPTWLLKMRVHKCAECGKVLARSCK